MDKAGAYAIQGLAARFIPRIDGSYSNVVGLPLAAVADLRERQLIRPRPGRILMGDGATVNEHHGPLGPFSLC